MLDVAYDWCAFVFDRGRPSVQQSRRNGKYEVASCGVMESTKLPAVIHQVTAKNDAHILIKELQKRKVGKMSY